MTTTEWVLRFIQDYFVEHARPPTVRDIQRALGMSSASVVSYHLDKLIKAGLITKDPEIARGVRIIERKP